MSGSFVGQLVSGKRVYVRRANRDRSEVPIAFAVFADVARDGKRKIVGRFHHPLLTADRPRRMFCANGFEHGQSACCWTPVSELTAEEAARWCAHWWTHVVDKQAEVVALVPTGPRTGRKPRERSLSPR